MGCFVYISCPESDDPAKKKLYGAYEDYLADYVMKKFLGIPIVPHYYKEQFFCVNDPDNKFSCDALCLKLLSECYMIVSGDDFGVTENMKKYREFAGKNKIIILSFKNGNAKRVDAGGDVNV